MQKIDVKKIFGSSLKACRKRLGFSQEKLAERAELHRTYICDVERGARNLSLDSVTRLAGALNVTVASLFPAELTEGEAASPAGDPHGRPLVEILLADDNAGEVKVALSTFKQARLANRVHVVSDGQEALDYLFCAGKFSSRKAMEHPPVVLLDLSLPKVSGLEVLRQMKADERTRDIPVIALAVSLASSGYLESQRLGAAMCIVKPLNFQRLSQIAARLKLDWALLKSP